MTHWSKEGCEEFVCQAWLVWSARFQTVHDKEHGELQLPHISVLAYLDDYCKAINELFISRGNMVSTSQVSWKPPSEGTIQIDVDASFNDVTNKCGLGGVIRDHEGQVVVVFGKSITKPDTVVIGELFAIREGLIVSKK